MKNINWKVRLTNKVWLVTVCSAILSIVYQFLELIGIAPVIPKEKVMDLITTVLTVLALLGVIIDPTTDGIEDSARALEYDTVNRRKG